MPKKAEATTKSKKSKKVFRSKEEIARLLQEIAASKTGGLTVTQALQRVGVSYNTYVKWVKRVPKPKPTPSVKKGRRSRTGRTDDDVRRILSEIASLRDKGMSVVKALKERGVPYSNYAYWRKKYGEEVEAVTAAAKKVIGAVPGLKAKGPSPKASSLVSILEEMAVNRKKRQELEQAEKQIQALDARYEELRKQL
jgi:transposase